MENKMERSNIGEPLSKFTRHQKIKTSEKLFNFLEPENDQIRQSGSDMFSSFLYQDHVTRYKYQFSRLKKWKIIKTCPDQLHTPQPQPQQESKVKRQSATQLNFYNEELKVLQAIKQNRNKDLLQNCKVKTMEKSAQRLAPYTQNHCEQVGKVKRKIRKQVLSLNHQFLREYLYHQQPFNRLLVEINHYSDAGIIDEMRINWLKQKIMKCIEQRKGDGRMGSKDGHDVRKLPGRKLVKLNNEKKVESRFQEIWQQLRQEIGTRVRMEGQYNLYAKSNKKTK